MLIEFSSFLGDESDMNALVKAMRFILRLSRTSPLSEALDLKTLDTPPKDPDFYWPGDANPDTVCSVLFRLFLSTDRASRYLTTR